MKPTVKITLACTGLLALWVLSGLVFPSSGDEEVAAPQEVDLSTLLKVEEMQAQPRRRHVVLYGETEPLRTVALKAETQGAVVEIPAKEGQVLKKGDVILKIDVRDRRERLRQAEALLRQREIEYKAAVKLQEKGFRTEVGLAEAKTRIEDARAALRTIQLDLEYTNLRAPFDAVLETINVEIGDFVGVGVFGGEGAIATVVDLNPVKITGQISQFDMPFLDKKAGAFITLADGTKHEGVIGYVSSVAERASRTFRVELQIDNPDHTIPAGVAAELHIPLDAVPAYRVNASALSLADDGKVGLKTVSAEGVVRFVPVTVIEETPEGIWVTGLPQLARIITLGHLYVSDGQQIDLAKIAAAAESSKQETR